MTANMAKTAVKSHEMSSETGHSLTVGTMYRLGTVEFNDILFINRLTAPPSATARPAILSSRDHSIAGYS